MEHPSHTPSSRSTSRSCAWRPSATGAPFASRAAPRACPRCLGAGARAARLPEQLVRGPSRAVDNGRVRRVSSPTFVGRAEQLAIFDRSLASAAEREPAVLLIAGESGVGKTRLVSEFGERARAAGARVVTGDCVELGEGELPYAPIVGALRDLGAEAIELAGPGRAELARLLPEAGEPAPAARDDEFAQARLFETLLTLLGRVGERAPLVLVIEDLHWADRSTRDFLSF